MATLRGIQGGSLVPNVAPSLNVLLGALGTPETRAAADAERQRQADIQEQIDSLIVAPDADPAAKKTTNQEALLRLIALDPKIGNAALAVLESGDEQQIEAVRREAQKGAKQAIFVSGQPDFAAKQRAISSLAVTAAARGEPLDRLIELQNMSEPELDLELERMKIAGPDLETVMGKKRFEPVTDAQGNIVAQREVGTGKVVTDPRVATPLSPRDEAFSKLTEEEQRRVLLPKPSAPKNAKAFLLPDGGSALSFDGGRTFEDQDGVTRELPSGSIPLGPETAVAEARAGKIRAQATKALEKAVPGIASTDSLSVADSAAALGTGPWSNILAATDAVIGGTFNLDTMFPQTQDNRQHLRLIKQTGKAALLNSARGAIWEQQKIDELFPDPEKFWANPDAEARKVPLMIQTLQELERLNNQVMSEGILSPKEIGERAANNIDIRRTLTLLGTGKSADSGSQSASRPQTQADFDALQPGALFIDPDSGETRRKQ